MPTWGELLGQLQQRAQGNGGAPPIDELRREALAALAALTGRPTIIYASRWAEEDAPPGLTAITIGDVHGFMEVLHGLPGPSLDLIVHSPGGSPTATEAIVSYLRTRFQDIRVVVPLAAMSAACMLACSANTILMGKHSYLGPIDPQLILQTPLGAQSVPAQAILQQFERAKAEAADQKSFAAWLPMLQQYGPALLMTCQNVSELSEQLVSKWLAQWMFSGDADGEEKSKRIAAKLNEHGSHRTHSRFLPRDRVKEMGLKVEELEADQNLQDAVLSVFHAIRLTFSMNPGVTKIVENHLGKAYVTARMLQLQAQPKPPVMAM